MIHVYQSGKYQGQFCAMTLVHLDDQTQVVYKNGEVDHVAAESQWPTEELKLFIRSRR